MTSATARGPSSAASAAETEQLVGRLVSLIKDHQPVEATALGDHEHDRALPDLAPAATDAWIRALSHLRHDTARAYERTVDDPGDVAREARGDLELLLTHLDHRLFWLQTWPSRHRDPLEVVQTASGSLHELLRRQDVAPETQARFAAAAVARARALPHLFEQAAALLEGTPAPHLEVARSRLVGLAGLVGDVLPERVAQLGGDLVAARDAAAVAIEGIEAFLALLDQLRDLEPLPWRLGPEHHARVLRATLGSTMPTQDIAIRAAAWLEQVTDELVELAGSLWPRLGQGRRPDGRNALLRATMQAVAAARSVPRSQLVARARAAVDVADAWARQAGLVDVPPRGLLTVTEVPAYLRGVAVAFIQPAPALEPGTGSTYYLSPVPDEWDDERAASFLREYNAAALEGLALHEAVPGHFVQLEHASRHPRLARRLLRSSAFAEGWAVHIEREAAGAGYGDDLYRFNQRKLELRIAANALLDVGLHAAEMDDEQAIALLTSQALQEEAEAAGKLVRAKVTAGQLCSYFVGGAEIGDLRDQVAARRGGRFDRRTFHQQLLSHGTPTVAIAGAAVTADEPTIRRPFGP